MRFLLDESISRRVAQPLIEAGHDAVHTSVLGLTSAPDPVVLQAAVDDDGVLLTLDTDFGTLLANSGDLVPSIVLFRGEVTRHPDSQAQVLLANLDQLEADLLEGALVVIGDNPIRIRPLPIEGDAR